MALIAMVTYDTEENDRHWMTKETLEQLNRVTNLYDRHRLFIVDNGSDEGTVKLLRVVASRWNNTTLIENGENIGTARAVNKAWMERRPGEVCVKMDNDVVIHHDGWLDEIEEVFKRSPDIGIVGLKRKDLEERPSHPHEHYRSQLWMLPHEKGQRWIVVEAVNHVIGTCQAYNPLLLEKIGYLEQGDSLYGFDDALASVRSHVAGFANVFLPHIDIDHIDPGGTDFTEWKQGVAAGHLASFRKARLEYQNGTRPLYCGPEGRPW